MWGPPKIGLLLWYLPSLSQLHVLKSFRFGILDSASYLTEQGVIPQTMRKRELADAYRTVLEYFVTGSQKISFTSQAKWRASEGMDQSAIKANRVARWRMIKTYMGWLLEVLGRKAAMRLLKSYKYA